MDGANVFFHDMVITGTGEEREPQPPPKPPSLKLMPPDQSSNQQGSSLSLDSPIPAPRTGGNRPPFGEPQPPPKPPSLKLMPPDQSSNQQGPWPKPPPKPILINPTVPPPPEADPNYNSPQGSSLSLDSPIPAPRTGGNRPAFRGPKPIPPPKPKQEELLRPDESDKLYFNPEGSSFRFPGLPPPQTMETTPQPKKKNIKDKIKGGIQNLFRKKKQTKRSSHVGRRRFERSAFEGGRRFKRSGDESHEESNETDDDDEEDSHDHDTDEANIIYITTMFRLLLSISRNVVKMRNGQTVEAYASPAVANHPS
ncbi:hypothetical protein ANCCEY_05159 [Ancylostoma ceylanicum]|uniref:Uncharacterized protein n=1 Tax=Ancylostoma ceylanicum TaxID=53326 RepID=A0A0D6M053_9BILA|nr:hypothetical protein ANCCEY_05159 [Ancylostoma ceylanicum]